LSETRKIEEHGKKVLNEGKGGTVLNSLNFPRKQLSSNIDLLYGILCWRKGKIKVQGQNLERTHKT